MKVHRELGNGFQEVIYQRALEIEFKKEGLSYEREKEMEIRYEGIGIGTRRVDFLVEGEIIVELKAIVKIEEVQLAQGINYLEAFGKEIGIMLNFGGRSLEYKRIINSKGKKRE